MHAPPPSSALQTIDTLAQFSAAASLCTRSKNGKTLAAEHILAFHAIRLNASELAEKIEKHYRDPEIMLIFELQRERFYVSESFRNEVKKSLSDYCSNRALYALQERMRSAQLALSQFIKK